MKAPFSSYLNEIAPGLRQLINYLSSDYDYVSVLSTDSKGLHIRLSQHAKTVGNQTMTTERGTVVRVYKDGLYSEYAMDCFDHEHPEQAATDIKSVLNAQLEVLKLTQTDIYDTGLLSDEPIDLMVEKETGQLPEEADIPTLISQLTKLSDYGMSLSEAMVDCVVTAQSTHISKLFMTANRYMRQSYVYSEGSIAAIISKDGQNRIGHDSISGLGGPELFIGLNDKADYAVSSALEMLEADRIVPGVYDIITAPEVTGLIAHEAFGHGVEMDLFVKGRALGADYIDQRVGSPLVTMHEGALCADNVTSYAFDDEGILAGDVVEIDQGILKTGICDALSALRLGVSPTGNGKRENFEHKVYTRMTNTLFDSGNDTLEDMIKSIDYGYLLEGIQSGMEDPKHWGIQCIIQLGREIKDGKLTGKVVSPVIMTGYVPDLLGAVTMANTDHCVFGSGGCGKGHKEWAKVSDGGPYLKTKGRLG
ncbi:MAG: TldD/PmbA family protein [Erysipelotrichaceae bacterium]|nr:TldD/PmbA family protein [Erysipelotrichaceae bacterium]